MNYRPSAELRHLHEEGYCYEDCSICMQEQTFDPPDRGGGRDLLITPDYREDR